MSLPIETFLILDDGERRWLGDFQTAYEARRACQKHAQTTLNWSPCNGETWQWQAINQGETYLLLKKVQVQKAPMPSMNIF